MASVAYQSSQFEDTGAAESYNGFGEPLYPYRNNAESYVHDPNVKKKGGWPSPRYYVNGNPKPGHSQARRFIVAPSTFVKAPKEEKQIMNFYAAPAKLPIFGSAVPSPVFPSNQSNSPAFPAKVAATNRITESVPEIEVDLMTPTKPVTFSSLSPHEVNRYSPIKAIQRSPTSPIKAKVAAAVANATATAQNAHGSGSDFDIDALMISLAAVGKELSSVAGATAQKKPPNGSLSQQQRMKELLHIMNPQLEEAYEKIITDNESANVDSKPEQKCNFDNASDEALSDKQRKVFTFFFLA